MQLPLSTYISGRKTVADWNTIRASLTDFNNISLWTTVYNDYFIRRLDDRYLSPIRSIKQDGCYTGEGFSIMTIICSLIEFLETTYQGKNYRYRRTGDPPLGQYEYGASTQIFIDFLINRTPFNMQFNRQNADDFYKNIRCGLLHEARTNGNWTIWGNSGNSILIKKTSTVTIIYRDDFLEALLKLINVDYKSELLSSTERKEAFIRKFDNLCEE
ncbi:hypothetical protein [Flavobacterium sp. JAS]|uniref:hypothetical protein n=1 Tax=Flavobacterium sp. JAS TaxID=2897329 RepID=UPI001E28F83C|nr:hypothetical protein [Flavobacterium sp. JAS]MCD0472569.1 hypothetical protein [Flavobacterium sp. JAS]